MEGITIFITNLVAWSKDFYDAAFFSVIKFIFGIYAVVLLTNIILLLIQRGLSGDIRDTFLGMNIPPELATRKGRLRKRWAKIKKRTKIEDENNWKAAIIEADEVINDLLKGMKYAGENMSERLANIPSGQIENVEELKIAHTIKNQIVQEENFRLSREKMEEVMEYYENFLRYFEVLE